MKMRLVYFFCLAATWAGAQDSPVDPAALAGGSAGDAPSVEHAQPPQTAAGPSRFPHGFSAKVISLDYDASPGGFTGPRGVELAYRYSVLKYLTATAPLRLGLRDVPGPDARSSRSQAFVGLDVTGQLGIDLLGDRLRPYVSAGVGFVAEPGGKSFAQVPVGAGLNYRVSQAASLTAQYDLRSGGGTAGEAQQLSLGVVFDLGRSGYEPKYWDSDGDGVNDDVDVCVDVPGSARYEGCPDTDADGFHDAIDPCPLAFSEPELFGCPDADADGVVDPQDVCPYEAGLPELQGCPLPDRDRDGVGDDVDQCPDRFGRLLGCPDADADGIRDADDKCPKTAGIPATGGCPDKDNDGVPDADDACPLSAGKLNGCPDRDGDGVDDSADRCPNISGLAEHDGCPAVMRVRKETFEYAMRAIAFPIDGLELDRRAKLNLAGLAAVMHEYPEYRVRFTGHADYEEMVANREAFSLDRANVAKAFLMAQGVSEDRVDTDAVGAGMPIARKGTAEERAVNRRVEIDLYVPPTE